jgi:hypothetical protein
VFAPGIIATLGGRQDEATAEPNSGQHDGHMGEAELAARPGRLSLEQKVRLLTGAHIWALYPESAIVLSRVV